jgi:hypothetical protein
MEGKLFAALALLIVLTGGMVIAQPKRSWQYECYNTVEEMVRKLNRLNAVDLHLMSVPSERNFMGLMGSPYCVVWR